MGTPHDESFDLSPLLEEPIMTSDEGAHHQRANSDIAMLLEANARLRAIAIELSNLAGDLPCLKK